MSQGAAREKRFFRKLRRHSWEGYYLVGYLLVIAQSAGRQHLRTESPGRKNVLILEESLFESAKHTVKKKKSIGRLEYPSICSNLLRLAFKCLQCQMQICHFYVFPRKKQSSFKEMPSERKKKNTIELFWLLCLYRLSTEREHQQQHFKVKDIHHKAPSSNCAHMWMRKLARIKFMHIKHLI